MKNQRMNDVHDPGTADDIIAVGAAAFTELRNSIHHTLLGLRTGFTASDDAADPVEGDVKVYLGEITKLLEAGNGESSGNVLPANPGNTLDLEAAREEIGSRLVKLVNQRGG